MRKLNPVPQEPSPDPVSLAAAAVNSLSQTLPAGTAFFIGIVLSVMMTGRLVQTKGSLARAALPFVLQLRWGWHRVERAMERGKFSLDAFLDRAYGWGVGTLPVEPVWLGGGPREGGALGSSTIARLRAVKRLALAGKGYCHRAGRAVRANIVAVMTSVVMIRGVRVGLVRRTRFGASGQEAVKRVFADLSPTAPPAQQGQAAGRPRPPPRQPGASAGARCRAAPRASDARAGPRRRDHAPWRAGRHRAAALEHAPL